MNNILSSTEVAVKCVELYKSCLNKNGENNKAAVDLNSLKAVLLVDLSHSYDYIINLIDEYWLDVNNISYLEFWKFVESIFIFKGIIKSTKDSIDECILSGMVSLRDGILEILKSETNISKDSISKKEHYITVGEIHNIILEIISNNIFNETSSAYWQDVLNQIPSDTDPNMPIHLNDISNAILQWLIDYLIGNKTNTTRLKSETISRVVTSKESWLKEAAKIVTNQDNISLLQNDVIDAEKVKQVIKDNISLSESFESPHWRDQTLFSNFRELQMILQSMLESIIITSRPEDKSSSRRNELFLRKISHMITELEDYIYNQFDSRQREIEELEQFKKENNKLKKSLRLLQGEFEEQSKDSQEVLQLQKKAQLTIEQLQSQKDKLTADLLEFHMKIKKREADYDELLSKYNELIAKHEALKEEFYQRGMDDQAISPSPGTSRLYNNKKGSSQSSILQVSRPLSPLELSDSMNNTIPSENTKDILQNFDLNIFGSCPNSSSIMDRNTYYSKDNLKYPKTCSPAATVTCVPDFLDNIIESPISCLSYRWKSGYFPERRKMNNSRLVSVVPLIQDKLNSTKILKGSSLNITSTMSNNYDISKPLRLKGKKKSIEPRIKRYDTLCSIQ
ncbi:hypothetical protein cand_006410 [Cryptosporidium andersoni]|uniref:Uncharacterized protein n=1 Tax=Cryptosporidium andersoni TaxID=117008 RepID=A0A1J4MS23_9CRYT|nr:hypothetical protein cand_006410 [Cryptosporidium andersoni]